MSGNKTFEFTLIYLLPEDRPAAEDHLDALFEAGCEDAIPGMGKKFHIALEFNRDAVNAATAVASAKENVEAAIAGGKLVEVRPDIVGASELAALANCSRQNVRKQLEKIDVLAPPVYAASGHTLWHLSLLNQYLSRQTTLSISPQIYEVSEVAMKANAAIQSDLLTDIHSGST